MKSRRSFLAAAAGILALVALVRRARAQAPTQQRDTVLRVPKVAGGRCLVQRIQLVGADAAGAVCATSAPLSTPLEILEGDRISIQIRKLPPPRSS